MFCDVCNTVGTPWLRAASYEPRTVIAILGIWDDKWLICGKYGIHLAVRCSYGVYVTPHGKWKFQIFQNSAM